MTARLPTNEQRAIVITALRHALPYLRVFKNKVFVLKAGGDAFVSNETTRALMEQVGILHQVGIRVVVVHGGGPQSTALAKRLGLSTQMVEGRRVTDAPTLEVSTMVLNGEINTRIVAMCRALGIPAIGFSGVDGGLIKASKRPPVQVSGNAVDYGFVGDILGHRHKHPAEAARQRLRADREPALGRRQRHAAEHQCRHGRSDDRLRAEGGEVRDGHGRAGHPGLARRPALADLVHRPCGSAAPARRRQDLRWHAAEGRGHRAGAVRRRAARARDLLPAARQPAARSLHERRHGHAGRQRHDQPAARGTD